MNHDDCGEHCLCWKRCHADLCRYLFEIAYRFKAEAGESKPTSRGKKPPVSLEITVGGKTYPLTPEEMAQLGTEAKKTLREGGQ